MTSPAERTSNFIADAVRPMIEREAKRAEARGARDALAELADTLRLRYPADAPAAQIRRLIVSAFGVRIPPPSLRTTAAFLAAGSAYGIDVTDTSLSPKCRPITRARWATWIALRRKGLSTTVLGRINLRGTHDHTSVLYGLRAARGLDDDITFQAAIAAAEAAYQETTP